MRELNNKYSDETETVNQVLEDLSEKGWVECIRKPSFWKITINILNRRTADRIWEWVYHSINGNIARENPYTDVKIHERSSRHTFKLVMADVLTGDFVFNHTCLSAPIQKFIERNLDYFMEEYLNMEEFVYSVKK